MLNRPPESRTVLSSQLEQLDPSCQGHRRLQGHKVTGQRSKGRDDKAEVTGQGSLV